jgi:ribosomal-protein-alanine N-acetyltransferase
MSEIEIPELKNLKIRSLCESDLIEVDLLERKIFPDPWPLSAFHEVLDNEEINGLVGLLNAQIVAYAVFTIGWGESRLANIAVAPDFRRKSIAKILISNILKIVKEANCKNIFLDVRPSNAAAINLYKNFGFTELYTKPNYYQSPKEDVLVMTKTLGNTN